MTHLVRIDEPAALGSIKSFGNLCGDLGAILRQPSFLLMEHGNGALDEFINRLVGPALNVLFDQLFQFRTKINFHADSVHLQGADGGRRGARQLGQ